MNWAETTTSCKSNEMDYSFEKSSISHCEKKCLAFRGAVQHACYRNWHWALYPNLLRIGGTKQQKYTPLNRIQRYFNCSNNI